MKCFSIFKDKSKPSRGKSAPELKTQISSSSKDTPVVNRATKSVGATSSVTKRGPEMYREKRHNNLKAFSLAELKEATNGFNKLLKIGEGGFGSVYKGSINPPDGSNGDPIIVAIKKLSSQSLQGHKEWLAEVKFLGIVEHPNLVKLLGFCMEDGGRGIHRLLVYEYMPNKSLEHHLFNKNMPTLSWKLRLQIMLGAAQGLSYLHQGCDRQVIYRDFKSSNVLLDQEFSPKLSDFGLAREGPVGEHTHVSTDVVGTIGYAAPEYVDTGHLTSKSDIYSFGVVLYEILSGRRTVERNRPPSEQKLLEWVKLYPVETRSFAMIMDPRIRNQYPLSSARRIAKLADSCLKKNAKDRPDMNEVVECLKLAIEESGEDESLSRLSQTAGLVSRQKNVMARPGVTPQKLPLPRPKDSLPVKV
ncbi:probable serine/threonine-protein kinase PBL19 [Impatiens glandulifera]|uniref:probable serine/threonine-protein kinase PBL19 n=1 Tax=Impatiens glandulifera TaxID=253017 RepID=UPI001FB103EE|nr:probable serine/threonine-protein kinase PBL19 [Impatiens glandulifera]